MDALIVTAFPNVKPKRKPDVTVDPQEIQAMQTRQTAIVQAFQALGSDWMERYQYLIDLGKKLPPLPAELRVDEHLVSGCQSQVWWVGELRDGKLYFQAGSDSTIVAGLIALLLRVYSGHSPAAILAVTPSFIADIGLDQHLSPTRRNGLASMWQALQTKAQRLLATAQTAQRH